MPTWVDVVFFLILAVFGPVWGATFGMRRLRRARLGDVPRVRGSVYRIAMIVQWGLAGLLFIHWFAADRPWSWIGLVLIVVGFALRQRAHILADEESLAEVRWKLQRLERMMPRTSGELRAFYGLSLTAGACEELLYRGFLIWFLGFRFGLIPAAALSALIFGFGHLYQGWRGVLTTGAVGAFLAAVYLLTGSLLASMVFHALMDIHSGNLAFHAFTRAPGEPEGPAVEGRSENAFPDSDRGAEAEEAEWGAGAEASEPWLEALEETSKSPEADPGAEPRPIPREGTIDGERA
jgi:membrane protease YdiL (CAAX protease family)